uniref:Uncharacterized protein n=1 Tax=Oryza barthii TaxID=65489 RepID=A0A0D3HDZ4_9ORYZ
MGCSLHAHVPAALEATPSTTTAMATEVLLLGDARAGEEAVDDDEGLVEEPQAAENVGAAAPAAP